MKMFKDCNEVNEKALLNCILRVNIFTSLVTFHAIDIVNNLLRSKVFLLCT
jgi:methylmalonyl-CoA mutase N-terminal domain/subunit